MGQRGSDSRFHITRIFEPNSADSGGLSHGREVRILECGAEVEESSRPLFELNEAECSVVENHDFDRQPELREGKEITHQHGESTIAGKRDNLTFWKRSLGADSLRHRVRHRAMPKRSDESPLAVHGKVARSPNRGQADIAREDCIFGCQIAQCLCNLLRVDYRFPGFLGGQIVEIFSRVLIVPERLIQVFAIFLLMEQREQSIDCRAHIADEPKIYRGAPSELLGPYIDLSNSSRSLRVKLPIRKIRAQHQQHVAIVDCVIARREADQAGQADVIQVVPFHVLLASEGTDHGTLQSLTESDELLVCASAARAAKQSDAVAVVQ